MDAATAKSINGYKSSVTRNLKRYGSRFKDTNTLLINYNSIFESAEKCAALLGQPVGEFLESLGYPCDVDVVMKGIDEKKREENLEREKRDEEFQSLAAEVRAIKIQGMTYEDFAFCYPELCNRVAELLDQKWAGARARHLVMPNVKEWLEGRGMVFKNQESLETVGRSKRFEALFGEQKKLEKAGNLQKIAPRILHETVDKSRAGIEPQ